jgi:sugar lactone lactonase YvrE
MIKDGRTRLVISDIPNRTDSRCRRTRNTCMRTAAATKYVRRYRVLPDDTVTDSQMFIDISGDKTPGITDGLKVDVKGNVWETAAAACGSSRRKASTSGRS